MGEATATRDDYATCVWAKAGAAAKRLTRGRRYGWTPQDVDDVRADLVTRALAKTWDPARSNAEAFATLTVKSAAAKAIRDRGRKRRSWRVPTVPFVVPHEEGSHSFKGEAGENAGRLPVAAYAVDPATAVIDLAIDLERYLQTAGSPSTRPAAARSNVATTRREAERARRLLSGIRAYLDGQ